MPYLDPGATNGLAYSYRTAYIFGSKVSAYSPVVRFSFADSDTDNLPDWWETAYFGTLAFSAADDTDEDGQLNGAALAAGTNPNPPLAAATHLRVLVPDRENYLNDPNDRNVELHWDAPNDRRVAQFRVEWSVEGSNWTGLEGCSRTNTHFPKHDLRAFQSYRVRVVSLNGGGMESASEELISVLFSNHCTKRRHGTQNPSQ